MGYIIRIFLFLSASLICNYAAASEPIIVEENTFLFTKKNNLSSKKFTWRMTPDIIICDYAPVEESRVRLALSWWRELGYSIFFTNSSYMKSSCYKDKPYGLILISLVSGQNYNDDSLATTRIYSDKNTNEILWVRIELKEGLVKERVLEHEIGHALGWMHIRKKGHMMNEKLSNGGWDSDGLNANNFE